MSTTYTWEITNLESFETIDGLNNAVSVVHWLIRAEDAYNSVSVNGTVTLDIPTAGSFVEYNDLTQEQVINWTKSKIGSKLENEYYQYLDQKLSELARPVVVSNPLPWIPVPNPGE